MDTSMLEKFNNLFDMEGLKHDIETSASSDGEFVEVPKGDYEVKVVKLELGQTGEKSKNPGMPMARVWFEVLVGDFKGQKIFMNQTLTSGLGIHKMNRFLESLETGIGIEFENFAQYDDLLNRVFSEVDGVAEFQLTYGENNKGFSTYTIVQRF